MKAQMNIGLIDRANAATAEARRTYEQATARVHAPALTLRAEWLRYEQRLRDASRPASQLPADLEAAYEATARVALESAAGFRKFAEMPADDLAELEAREQGRASPRAMQASQAAKLAAQHKLDKIAREAAAIANAPDWTAAKFIAKLAKRGVFITPDASGRIIGLYGKANASGELTELETAICQSKGREIVAALRPARRV